VDYIQIAFANSTEQNDLLIALLSDQFDSFEESESGLKAFVPAEKFSEENLKETLSQIENAGNITYTITLIKDQNWNALWESNFEPVMIGNEVYVRAPFHPEKPGVRFEIVMEPKMSFGTGHHATTSLMMEEMLKLDLHGKSVLDIGCGTGILAILATKLGAKNVLAVDIEQWAFNNAIENCERNYSQQIIVQKGDAELIRGKSFDVILANINRNVLLQDMKIYADALHQESHLLLSGFMTMDVDGMKEAASAYSFKTVNESSALQWAMIHFQKTIENR
jgi:ribosomal protein L11 methyltransferase